MGAISDGSPGKAASLIIGIVFAIGISLAAFYLGALWLVGVGFMVILGVVVAAAIRNRPRPQ